MTKNLLLVVLALSAGGAIFGQSLQPPYSTSYTLVTLGTVPSVPADYGAIAFLNPSTLLLTGASEGTSAAIYALPIVRAANGHITGFGTATLYASAPELDGGLAFGPGGDLFGIGWNETFLEFLPGATSPSATIDLSPWEDGGALQFVPAGMPGAGVLKLAQYGSAQWFDGTLTPNGDGTYSVSLTPTVTTPTE